MMKQLNEVIETVAVAFKSRDEHHKKFEEELIVILKDHRETITKQQKQIKELENTLTDLILTGTLPKQN